MAAPITKIMETVNDIDWKYIRQMHFMVVFPFIAIIFIACSIEMPPVEIQWTLAGLTVWMSATFFWMERA